MYQQEPLERKKFQTSQEPIEPLPHDHFNDHREAFIMNQQEPLEREELQKAQDSTEPVEPTPQDHYIDHRDGLVEPIIKEYIPLQVGMVIFSIAILVVVFIGSTTNMWGLGN